MSDTQFPPNCPVSPDYQPKKQIFDSRVTLGSVVQILMMLFAILWWAATQSGRISIVENNASATKEELNKIEGKVDSIDTKITDLAYTEGQQSQKLEDERRENKNR